MKEQTQTRIIALVNHKGGVGKTTSVISIGSGLCALGKNTAVIDLDPQAQTTCGIGIKTHDNTGTVYELLKGEVPVECVIQNRGKLKVIPSSLNLSGAEIEFSGLAGREYLLKENLQYLDSAEFVLIDCAPSLGLLTLNALVAADEVFIPVQCEYLALQGMSKLLETIDIVKKRLNKKLAVTGVICTRYDSRKNLNKEVVGKIHEYFGEKVFDTLIRENVSLAEAPGFGKSIFEYKPESTGAEDYLALCKEILAREEKP